MAEHGDAATRLGLIGAGLIGARHAQLIRDDPDLILAGIADPSAAARALARQHGVAHYDDVRGLIEREALDGVIVAAPNRLHGPIGLACLERGLPLLVEKPIADTFEAGAALVAAAERQGLPLLVGHHRRFHAMVEATHAMLGAGEIGDLVAVSAMWATRKPDALFRGRPWRHAAGGGPVLINLIHDIDCLRHFAGEIEEVHAIASNARRGFEVEDTAVAAPALCRRRARHGHAQRLRALALGLGGGLWREPRHRRHRPELLSLPRHPGLARLSQPRAVAPRRRQAPGTGACRSSPGTLLGAPMCRWLPSCNTFAV